LKKAAYPKSQTLEAPDIMRRNGKVKARILHVDRGQLSRRTDALAVEEPLEILLRAGDVQKTLAITMRTPGHDYELAAGFLYGEGVIGHKAEIDHMIYCVADSAQRSARRGDRLERQEYNLLRVQLARQSLPDLAQLDRHFFTNSACGVCGRTMLDTLEERALPPLASDFQVPAELLTQLPPRLRAAQTLFDATGGLHAAALFDAEGKLLALREDVGRHNALDKLVGWGLLNNRLPFAQHIILVSGRASYELLQKCRAAGGPILCAVSAPSSLAVDLANRFDMTLVAFLRGERFNIYAGAGRILLNRAAPARPNGLHAPTNAP
jgi:FdhD protein